ncbi:hypothetical protein QQP08_016126 [Theobroma cacao]|nr:hypothetical protein QQP08_016126 [Theobroma cacao]
MVSCLPEAKLDSRRVMVLGLGALNLFEEKCWDRKEKWSQGTACLNRQISGDWEVKLIGYKDLVSFMPLLSLVHTKRPKRFFVVTDSPA